MGPRSGPLPSALLPHGHIATKKMGPGPGPDAPDRSPHRHKARDRMPAQKKDRATDRSIRPDRSEATDRSIRFATDRMIAQSHGRIDRRAARCRPGESRAERGIGCPRSCSCESGSSGRPRLALAPSFRRTRIRGDLQAEDRGKDRGTSSKELAKTAHTLLQAEIARCHAPKPSPSVPRGPGLNLSERLRSS